MDAALRKVYIQSIIRDLDAIGGASFERFARLVVDRIVPVKMNHRGLSVQELPVGYTVDSVSDDGHYVAEYSSEAGYFEGKLVKLRKDLRHAITQHPGVKEVTLLSSRVCGPKSFTLITRTAGRLVRWRGIGLRLYDSRRIAEHIVDELLLDEPFVESAKQFLPSLARLHDEYASSHLTPMLESDYLPRPEQENEISQLLSAQVCLEIAGISGSGKSSLASAVVASRRQQYQLVLWLDASGIQRIEDLQDVDVRRNGTHRNVLALLHQRSCLLVLDDSRVEISLDKLRASCGTGSHVLITRQSRTLGAYEIPPFSSEQARTVLQRGVQAACPDATFEVIWRTVGGHPLTLRLMNVSVREGSRWEDLAEDCQSVGNLVDTSFRPLAERLLARFVPALGRELAFVSWCGTPRVDRELARAILTPNAVQRMERACLLARDRPDVLRVHDIVFSSLAALQLPVPANASGFVVALERYIRRVAPEKGLPFLRVAHLHQERIISLLKEGEFRDAFVYSYLFSRFLKER